MAKFIDLHELQQHLPEVVDQMQHDQEPRVLTRGDQPAAVIMSYEEYQDLRQLRLNQAWDQLAESVQSLAERNAQFSDEEIERDIEQAREEIWRESLSRADDPRHQHRSTSPHSAGK